MRAFAYPSENVKSSLTYQGRERGIRSNKLESLGSAVIPFLTSYTMKTNVINISHDVRLDF